MNHPFDAEEPYIVISIHHKKDNKWHQTERYTTVWAYDNLKYKGAILQMEIEGALREAGVH